VFSVIQFNDLVEEWRRSDLNAIELSDQADPEIRITSPQKPDAMIHLLTNHITYIQS
jgi:hypothetical protein